MQTWIVLVALKLSDFSIPDLSETRAFWHEGPQDQGLGRH